VKLRALNYCDEVNGVPKGISVPRCSCYQVSEADNGQLYTEFRRCHWGVASREDRVSGSRRRPLNSVDRSFRSGTLSACVRLWGYQERLLRAGYQALPGGPLYARYPARSCRSAKALNPPIAASKGVVGYGR
jgi:hypothetical protein